MNKLVITALTAAVVSAPAYARGDYEYAKVVSADPIYRTVRVSTPRQECYDERVVTREPAYRSNGDPGAALFGAILGGVAGHQFGKGSGKSVATAAGALIGAGIGQSRTRSYSGATERVSYETRCSNYDDYRTEQRVEGYDVTYRYNGRTYHTRMPHDPGNRIPVRVDVSPAHDSGYDY